MKELGISISEAARQLNVESHVLRYWEEELDIKVPRNEMGYRCYGTEEMKLLHNVKKLKNQGFQLRAIKLLLKDLKNGEDLNLDKLISMRDEINRKVESIDLENPHFQISDDGKVTRLPVRQESQFSQYSDEAPEQGISQQRAQQFQYIMIRIMNQALKDQGSRLAEELRGALQEELSEQMVKAVKQELSLEFTKDLAKQVASHMDGKMVSSMSEQIAMSVEQTLGDHICDDVSTRIMKEMNYLARMQEEQQEDHYEKLDALLRERQERNSRGKRKTKRQLKKEAKEARQSRLVAAAKEKNTETK